MKNKDLYFSEVQKFRQVWIWVILVIIAGIGFYGLYQQLVLGIPFGNHPSSDLAIIAFSILPVFIILLFLFLIRLKTEIYKEGISVQFIPVHFKPKQIVWSEIEEYYIREYSPLKEYGGWGVRYNFTGKNIAYNISGKTGLQLVLNNGKKILIGTQKPQEMELVLDKLRNMHRKTF